MGIDLSADRVLYEPPTWELKYSKPDNYIDFTCIASDEYIQSTSTRTNTQRHHIHA